MMTDCLLCGHAFKPRPNHPCAELTHCPFCWPTVVERLAVYGYPGGLPRGPATRADEV